MICMYQFKNVDELRQFLTAEVVGTQEALDYLDCSRQNLHSYVKRGKLVPIFESARERFFLKSDLEIRKAEAAKYNRNPNLKTEQ